MIRKLMSLFHRVDQVQSQADSLNELIYDRPSPSEDDFIKTTYGLTTRQCERLGVTFLKYQDQVLGPWSVRRFENRLKKKHSILAYFLDFQHLTVMLKLYYQGQPEFKTPSPACPV
jgi:hypothetical protein